MFALFPAFERREKALRCPSDPFGELKEKRQVRVRPCRHGSYRKLGDRE